MRLIPVQPPHPAAVTTPAFHPPPAAGERLIGKYRVKGELGRGGMGAVYLAEQPGLGREVAIKELILSPAADPTALMRFLQEAQVMARTSHPNLVQVHDLEQIGDANYIVLEFVRGKSLREGDAGHDADGCAQRAEGRRFNEELAQNVLPTRAQRLPNSDLTRPLGDGDQHDVHDDDRTDDETHRWERDAGDLEIALDLVKKL